MSEAHDRLVAILRDLAENPPDPAKLAAETAARTDPWRWYCRLCGGKGQADTEQERDALGRAHLAGTRCGRHEVTGWEKAGRLLHVWTFPASAVAQTN